MTLAEALRKHAAEIAEEVAENIAGEYQLWDPAFMRVVELSHPVPASEANRTHGDESVIHAARAAIEEIARRIERDPEDYV